MKLLAAIACAAFASSAGAQVFSVTHDEPAPPGAWSVPGPRPQGGTIVQIDLDALHAALDAAPDQKLGAPLRAYGSVLSLPSPTGGMTECFVAESPVMEEPLQARFPHMRTYLVQAADGSAAGRLEFTQRGLTAMLRTADGRAWMIDPWNSGDPNHAVVYWLHDLPNTADWTCHTTEGVHGFGEDAEHDHDHAPRGADDTQIHRTVRLAVACTGEYGLHQCTIQGHEPNIDDPLAAIVTVVSRTNVVYEADLAVHFNLVANNDLIIYVDPATDPYPDSCDGTGGGDCSGPYLQVNINNLANVIGNANFDVGHLLTRVFGGVAYLSSVCGPNKAGGISGIPRGGDVDPLSALVIIHELGHQFGANHTFSGTRGRCAGNVRLQSAWEAGSGSSPLGYAGGCPVGDEPPSDNIVQFADPFFHHGSVREMQNFLGRQSTTCPVETDSGNHIPVLTFTTPDTAIPPATAFVLTASATDADGDTLMYSWEQYDSGVARPLSGAGSEDNGEGALFRVFPPVLESSRTFPQMSDILAGVHTPGERLPTVTNVIRRFRVIVRDNRPGAGAVIVSPFTRLTIAPGTSAFSVVSPAEGESLSEGPATITWTVGNTTAPPISCSSVTIHLSTDDGATFPHNLGTFPNTGSATVMIPPASTNVARVRIDADGRIFFAMSRPFSISGKLCPADFNADGFVDSQDFFDFVGAFFGNDPSADFNGDEVVNSQDFFDFLGAFFTPC